MQKDCREQSLPVLHGTCTSLCNGRSYAPRLRLDLVGAGLPANSAYGLTLWKVRGTSTSVCNACSYNFAAEGVPAKELEASATNRGKLANPRAEARLDDRGTGFVNRIPK